MQSAGLYNDFSQFAALRRQAQSHEASALPKVAKQFEGLFLQMVMKSMREANQVFSKDNPFHSDATNTYQQMYDQQMALCMSQGNGLGLAKTLMDQLSHNPHLSKTSAKDDLSRPQVSTLQALHDRAQSTPKSREVGRWVAGQLQAMAATQAKPVGYPHE